MIIIQSIDQGTTEEPFDYYSDKREKMNDKSIVSKVRSKEWNRQSLQTGEDFLPMTDDELHEFFTNDMRKIKPGAKVNKIPEGEPVFIFCVIQGLCNPVMAFIDSGANC